MKTLLLMRHAKSSWDHGNLEDHDRPLNARGRAACRTMGAWLVDQNLEPDAVWVSSAARTRETWARLSASFASPPAPRFERQLYLSGPQRMLDFLNMTDARATCALLIAHQPGMSAITAMLSDPQGDPGFHDAARHFPTGAIAVLKADIGDWSVLSPQGCRFVTFARPRDLRSPD